MTTENKTRTFPATVHMHPSGYSRKPCSFVIEDERHLQRCIMDEELRRQDDFDEFMERHGIPEEERFSVSNFVDYFDEFARYVEIEYGVDNA